MGKNIDINIIVAQVAKLTDSNNHGEVKQYICEALGFESLAEQFALINRLHDIDGHLYTNLSHYRADKNNEMFELIESHFGKDARKSIYLAM